MLSIWAQAAAPAKGDKSAADAVNAPVGPRLARPGKGQKRPNGCNVCNLAYRFRFAAKAGAMCVPWHG